MRITAWAILIVPPGCLPAPAPRAARRGRASPRPPAPRRRGPSRSRGTRGGRACLRGPPREARYRRMHRLAIDRRSAHRRLPVSSFPRTPPALGRFPLPRQLFRRRRGAGLTRIRSNEDYVTTRRPDWHPCPVVLYGPTASGKSALALALAERDGGVVINADASQVYACWRVLTARPGDGADLARAPHRLYGHVDCATRLLRPAPGCATWRRRWPKRAPLGLRPIVVGGTGLYLTALTKASPRSPKPRPSSRARSEALIAASGPGALLAELAASDPETFARIDRAEPAPGPARLGSPRRHRPRPQPPGRPSRSGRQYRPRVASASRWTRISSTSAT